MHVTGLKLVPPGTSAFQNNILFTYFSDIWRIIHDVRMKEHNFQLVLSPEMVFLWSDMLTKWRFDRIVPLCNKNMYFPRFRGRGFQGSGNFVNYSGNQQQMMIPFQQPPYLGGYTRRLPLLPNLQFGQQVFGPQLTFFDQNLEPPRPFGQARHRFHSRRRYQQGSEMYNEPVRQGTK